MKNIVEATRRFLANDDLDVAGLFGDCSTGEMEANLPLQAADLLRWHLQRYRGGFARTEENRMWYLLKECPGALHEWSRELLDGFAAPCGAP